MTQQQRIERIELLEQLKAQLRRTYERDLTYLENQLKEIKQQSGCTHLDLEGNSVIWRSPADNQKACEYCDL